jgi:hypothetical protein
VFKDEDLHRRLVEALANSKTDNYARQCLEYIEEPALAYLENLELTEERSKAIVDIKKAIEKRLEDFPESTWYSGTGD